MAQPGALAAPTIPAAVNGVLDLSGMTDVEVHIPVYGDFSALDQIVLHFDDVRIPVAGPPKARDPGSIISVGVQPAQLSNGESELYYVAVDAAQNITTSEVGHVTVVNAQANRLPAPTFPAYLKGFALRKQVLTGGGVNVRVKIATLQAGDQIRLSWVGYFESGEVAPDAAGVLLDRPVADADLRQGYIDAWAGMSMVLAVGPYGSGVASFVVLRGPAESQVQIGVSRPGRLTLSDDVVFLLAAATSGVSVRLPDVRPNLRPANRLWVGGPPHTDVTVSVDRGAMFDVTPPVSRMQVRTDVRGLAVLDVYLEGPCDGDVTCTITVDVVSDDGGTITAASTTTTFSRNFRIGPTGSVFGSSPDFAVADGVDDCMVCVFTSSVMRSVPVSVSGGALICGYSNTYKSTTYKDYSCTISIVCAIHGPVGVTVGDNNTAYANFSIDFRNSPFSPT